MINASAATIPAPAQSILEKNKSKLTWKLLTAVSAIATIILLLQKLIESPMLNQIQKELRYFVGSANAGSFGGIESSFSLFGITLFMQKFLSLLDDDIKEEIPQFGIIFVVCIILSLFSVICMIMLARYVYFVWKSEYHDDNICDVGKTAFTVVIVFLIVLFIAVMVASYFLKQSEIIKWLDAFVGSPLSVSWIFYLTGAIVLVTRIFAFKKSGPIL